MSSKYGEDEKKISLNVAMRMPYTGQNRGTQKTRKKSPKRTRANGNPSISNIR